MNALCIENSHMNDAEIRATLSEMMNTWDQIMKSARKLFPNATDDQLYEIAKNAMNRAVGIKC